MKIPVKRVGLNSCAKAEERSAGTIASRNGSAIVAPTPRRNVLRGSVFLVMNMSSAPPHNHSTAATVVVSATGAPSRVNRSVDGPVFVLIRNAGLLTTADRK